MILNHTKKTGVVLLVTLGATVWWMLHTKPNSPDAESITTGRNVNASGDQWSMRYRPTEPNHRRSPNPPNPESQAVLKNQIGRLNREVEQLRIRLDGLADAGSIATSSTEFSNEDSEGILTEEELEAQGRAQIQERLGLFDAVAAREGVDQKWAPNAESDLYDSFQNLAENGVGVREVKCHSSFCQARFSYSDEDSEAGIRDLAEASPWPSQSLIWIEDISQGEGVIYLAREGQTLPANSDEL